MKTRKLILRVPCGARLCNDWPMQYPVDTVGYYYDVPDDEDDPHSCWAYLLGGDVLERDKRGRLLRAPGCLKAENKEPKP